MVTKRFMILIVLPIIILSAIIAGITLLTVYNKKSSSSSVDQEVQQKFDECTNTCTKKFMS